MTDPLDEGPDRLPMEPERARGILNSTLAELPGVVYRCRNDRDWTMLGLTANVEELTGYSASALLGSAELAFVELVHPDDRDRVWSTIQRAVDAEVSYRVTYRIRTRSDEERWVLEQGRSVEGEEDGIVLTGYIQDISGPFARQLAAAERATSEARLRSQTLSSLHEAVLVVGLEGEERVIQEVNDAAERIFGYGREELIGETTAMLHVDRASYERFAEEGEPVLREEGVFRATFPMRRKDGTVFQAEQTVTLLDPEAGVDGGAVSAVRDVSEQVEAEERLRRSEERFRQITGHIDDVFWITTPGKDVMEYVSPAYRDVMGYPPEELYESAFRWLDHVHPDDRDRVRRALPDQTEGTYEQEYRIVRPDGEVRWIWDRAFPIEDEEGEVYRIVGVAEDVTERRRLEEQLHHAQKMEAVGRLAGGIAHDFNNLLTVIRSEVDLMLLDWGDAPGLSEDLEVVRDAAVRASRLTGQLLAFSRDQVLRPRVVDLSEIVGAMDPLLRRVLGEDVRVETDLAPDLPPVRVDPTRIEQVIVNLAVNAREAMPEGGTLRLSTFFEEEPPEWAALQSESGDRLAVRLDVADTGVGMDEPTLRQAFEPFFTTKRDSGGTGLGLATAYGIVEQSGGGIHAESEPGEGTVFSIRLPPAQGEPEELDGAARGGRELVGDIAGAVLVVEDDSSVRTVARRVLERGGLDVHAAEDAETALRMLEEEADAFSLLLSDLVLPGMGGRDLVEAVRERWPDLPVLVMSGYAEGSPGSRGELPAEIGFVRKPFTPSGLLRAVEEAMGRG